VQRSWVELLFWADTRKALSVAVYLATMIVMFRTLSSVFVLGVALVGLAFAERWDFGVGTLSGILARYIEL
jgi:hypothetical protein